MLALIEFAAAPALFGLIVFSFCPPVAAPLATLAPG